MSVKIDSASVDYLAKKELQDYQTGRLREVLDYVSNHSPYYQQLFEKKGIDPESIRNFDDFRQLPITEKRNLAENPTAFLCVPRNEIREYVTTSGTMGNPITVYLTENDIDRLAYNESISMEKAGCTSEDIFQLATTMDKRFMAGLAYAEGVRRMKAGLIRVGASSPSLQWDSIQRFQPTVLIAIPTFVLALIDYAKKEGIDYRNSSLKKVIAIGQPLRNQDLSLNLIGQRIQDEWGLDVYSTYASTEMGCAFTECSKGQGGHLQAELLHLEVLDKAGKEVTNGEQGEVVITTLGVEGMPLLRYRTGDIATKYEEACGCGRTTPRLGPILGRKKQMIKYKGTTVHPSSLIPLLDVKPEVGMYVIELATDELGLDVLNVILAEERFDEDKSRKLMSELGDFIKVKPTAKLIPQAELKKLVLEPSSRKPIKILDRR